MLLALTTTSQERFTLSAFTEFPDKDTHNEGFDYGANIGLQIEYQMNLFFFDAETYFFPGLNEIDYFHFQGTVLGFNLHSKFRNWRYYAGIFKPGFIIRGGNPYPMVGQDLGIERYFDAFYIGAEIGQDYCKDDKYWGSDSGHWRRNLRIKIGIEL